MLEDCQLQNRSDAPGLGGYQVAGGGPQLYLDQGIRGAVSLVSMGQRIKVMIESITNLELLRAIFLMSNPYNIVMASGLEMVL
jgi:hypothetical protein